MGEVSLVDISKRFTLRVDGEIHTVQALSRVSFTVKDGEIVALIGPSGLVLGTDLSLPMLERAKRHVEGLPVSLVAMDGQALACHDASFDAVVTRLSVHHFDRPGRVISEIFRVLRRGGKFVVADVISSEVPTESELQNAIEILRDPSHVRAMPGAELTRLFAAAG